MNRFVGCFDYTFRKAKPSGGVIVFSTSKTLRDIAFAAAGAAALALVGTPAPVQAASMPFEALSGSWAGIGTITMASGTKERLRCRARYDVNGGGSALDLRLRCASDSITFELQSSAGYQNGAVTGRWSETTRGVGGSLEGSARGNRINVRVSGVISALLAVSTNANQQSISIEAPGTDMAAVAISLSRGAK
jgi:hypothetical protein